MNFDGIKTKCPSGAQHTFEIRLQHTRHKLGYVTIKINFKIERIKK